MPFKAPATPKCPKCTKSVYAAESRVVGELQFHKECYKCSMCNKMLDSTNQNCHETVLYCKTCHGRKYGPKGYGFGGGAAGLSMDTGAHLGLNEKNQIKQYKPPQAAPGEGCPRCGGKVYAAELMLAKGKVYHRTCFNCRQCRKPLDSVLHCDGPDKEVYCKVCYGKKFGPKGYGFGQGGAVLQCDPDSTPIVRAHGNPNSIMACSEGDIPCPRCGGKVFMAETMMAKGRPFHKHCFKCRNCKRPLDSTIHNDGPDGEVYCKLCYAKKYGPKGYGFAAGAGGMLVAENVPGGDEVDTKKCDQASLDVTKIQATDGTGCPRCGGKVFMAEEMHARGKSWHKRCFNCCHCHRPLDSVVGCDAPDGEIYCKLCYAKSYGPKGYGFAAGAGGVLTAENITKKDGAPEGPPRFNPDSGRLDTAKIKDMEGKGCPRCQGKVFMAEERHSRGRSYHMRCYNCKNCHRPLDSVVSCDAPDGEVYCKLCYAKAFGPKGYGFAAGAGGVLTAENIPSGGDKKKDNRAEMSALDTTLISAAPGEGCPRCGGKVFNAEEKLSRGRKWHKRCYNCCECRRPLDSMVLCDAPDGEIYCKLCYAKQHGPKGYGFAGGAGGVMFPDAVPECDEFGEFKAGESGPNPAFTVLDVTKIPAREGQSRCPRCGGAVYQAESQFAKGKEWHKRCYNCCQCHRPLDSMTACDAPDGELYCKLCYAKVHGPKGYGFGHTAALVSLGTEDGVAIPTDIRQFGFGAKPTQDFVPPIPFHPYAPSPANPPTFAPQGPPKPISRVAQPSLTVGGGQPSPMESAPFQHRDDLMVEVQKSRSPSREHSVPQDFDQHMPVANHFDIAYSMCSSKTSGNWGQGQLPVMAGEQVDFSSEQMSAHQQSMSQQMQQQQSSSQVQHSSSVQQSGSSTVTQHVTHETSQVVKQVQMSSSSSSSSSSQQVVTQQVMQGGGYIEDECNLQSKKNEKNVNRKVEEFFNSVHIYLYNPQLIFFYKYIPLLMEFQG
ncbi:unnamed protein product [Meganyctiphanes norvegica]|uniref:LIM zinc-binding domain-containing protein n=1 Tax=Meganyctiphanes norvegica TaxID=48144 RepID=A0AAV2RKT7_MEGNR